MFRTALIAIAAVAAAPAFASSAYDMPKGEAGFVPHAYTQAAQGKPGATTAPQFVGGEIGWAELPVQASGTSRSEVRSSLEQARQGARNIDRQAETPQM